MQLRKILVILLFSALVVGCVGKPYPAPPHTLGMLDADRQRRTGGYPTHTVLLYNSQRVQDSSLSVQQRLDSVAVLKRLTVNEPALLGQFATLLEDRQTAQPVRKAVLDLLISQDYPGLAGYVVDILPTIEADSEMRKNLLGWLSRHGEPGVLAEVVKAWARQSEIDPASEKRYRSLVARLARVAWNEALWGALNNEAFLAKGSALEILAGRIDKTQMLRRLKAMPTNTQAIAAMKAFAKLFDYVPRTAEQLKAAAQVYVAHGDAMSDARKRYIQWRSNSDYTFRIEDFHVLYNLAGDPLRKAMPRNQLLLSLGQATRQRSHVSWKAGNRGQSIKNPFWDLAEKLSTADLWTLYLINEMLANPANQAQLYLTARDDWRDRKQVYGGLIRYVHGRASRGSVHRNGRGGAIAYRYPNEPRQSDNQEYAPDQLASRDGRDSLCWFLPHFQEVNNALRTGPDEKLLELAKQQGMRGLVLTSLDATGFAAHYFSPTGVVVSLGVFPFRK